MPSAVIKTVPATCLCLKGSRDITEGSHPQAFLSQSRHGFILSPNMRFFSFV